LYVPVGKPWLIRVFIWLEGFFPMKALNVELVGKEIVISKPGTDVMTAYRKAGDRPKLVLSRGWLQLTTISLERCQFRSLAYQAAVTKARELGWIV
jgi:hypothetical protein